MTKASGPYISEIMTHTHCEMTSSLSSGTSVGHGPGERSY